MRSSFSEFIGTATLALAVVGSGAMAETLTEDIGLQLLINGFATAAVLWLLITLFTPISGAHFNPIISIIFYLRREISLKRTLVFSLLQISGAVTGTISANFLFDLSLINFSTKIREGWNLQVSEIFATAGLVFLIFTFIAQKRANLIPVGVASWIFGAYFFTSSTSFANPAITIGRSFSNSFAGIAPSSVTMFVAFQVLGAAIGYLLHSFLSREVVKK